jgi:non-ribosomal peptide synthetase component F
MDSSSKASPEDKETPERAEPFPASKDSLAMVLYSPGSEGEEDVREAGSDGERGVLLSHGNLLNLLFSWGDYLGLGPESVFFARSEASLPEYLLETLIPLAKGARVFLPAWDGPPELSAVAAEARERGATHLLLPESVALSYALSFGIETLKALISYGKKGLGGERIDPAFIRELLKTAGNARLVSAYGRPEAGLVCLSETAHPERLPETLGTPSPNSPAFVTNKDGELLPTGYPGELRIGGAGTSLGYLGDPSLTAERFPEDSIVEESPAAWNSKTLFRTGDICRRRPDGRFDYLGNLSEGNLSLSRIERALLGYPGVINAKAYRIPEKKRKSQGTGVLVYVSLYPLPSPQEREKLAASLRLRLFQDLPASHAPDKIIIGGAPPLDIWGRLRTETLS